MKFILPMYIEMPTIVGILILISKVNATSKKFYKQEKTLFFSILRAIEISCSVGMSVKKIILGPDLIFWLNKLNCYRKCTSNKNMKLSIILFFRGYI